MALEHDVLEAMTSFMVATGMQGRAVLIGGQAIRDWYHAQAHALAGTAITVPVPRATTDMDVHLLIEKTEREEVARNIMQDWSPVVERANDRTFSFNWRQDPEITLDLIATTAGQSASHVQLFARLSTGAAIGAVRVLAPWIIRHHCHERCFGPQLARLHLRRLNRLGLVASKIGAVNNAINELISAGRESREPKLWTRRIDKDLQDLVLLLQPIWVDELWEPHYAAAGAEISLAWTDAIEGLLSLRERPTFMSAEAFAEILRIQVYLPRRLTR